MKPKHTLANLSERRLLCHFGDLVREDRRCTAALLAAIAEIDGRKLWAKHACPSMFAFCVERFHMSESMAAKRIWAARTARRFPVIFDMVARGELHLSAVVKIARHLTEQNHRAVLFRARHKSSREIDLLIAEVAPRPDASSRIRALPRSTGGIAGPRGFVGRPPESVVHPADAGPGSATCSVDLTDSSVRPTGSGVRPTDSVAGAESPRTTASAPPRLAQTAVASTVVSRAPATAEEPRPRGRLVPLSPRRYKVEVTVDQNTHDKLRMLEDLLGHQLPSADLTVIVSRAIDLLLTDVLRKKAAVTDRARPGHRCSDGRSRAIPAAIRREVWQRDGGRCTFVDQKGRRCRSTRRIEYHHQTPYAEGGRHETTNIALRCRAHNQYQADLDFGRDFMRDKRCGNDARSPGNVRCRTAINVGSHDLA